MKPYLKHFIFVSTWLFYCFTPTPLLANDIYVPPNAYKSGNAWYCNSGYKRSGNECLKLNVPENAYVSGNAWYCNKGYKKSINVCIPMTEKELLKQRELEQAILNKMQRRKLQGVSGDDCETEYKTNAEVCVEITGGDLDCNENYAGDYYRDCDVALSYEVQTDYQGGAYLDVEVECTVEIEYKGRQTYTTQSDSSYEDESHSLYAYGSESDTMNFNFSFSSYQEITNVKISSAECEIESVDMY